MIPPLPYRRARPGYPIPLGETLGFCCGLINVPQLFCGTNGQARLSTITIVSNIYVFVILKYFEPILLLCIGLCALIAWPLASTQHRALDRFGLFVWSICLLKSVILFFWGPLSLDFL